MKKIYACFISLFVFISFISNAQPVGDICSNPIVADLCNPSLPAIYTSSYNNDVTTWQVGSKNITAPGSDIYYQINIPTSSYQVVSLSASLAGYFNNCFGINNCSGEIYFLWFEGNPCNSNPVAVDSASISGNSSSFEDSIYVSYPVANSQSQYYLVIAFNSSQSYYYTLQLGYTNNQPLVPPTCTPGTPPLKGTVSLDKSKCYTFSNPYYLFLSILFYDQTLPYILIPQSQGQSNISMPIDDNYGNGYTLSLKTENDAMEQVFTSFDQFPYYYSTPGTPGNEMGNYNINLTVFLKNATGEAGIKGFRMRVPGGSQPYSGAELYPASNSAGTYNTSGNWNVNYNSATSTYTWLFSSSNGRGDNASSDYGCQVYNFMAQFYNLGDSIEAWYLPDYYGNDSLNCVPGTSIPPRTDCELGASDYQDGWIPLGNNGIGIPGVACPGEPTYTNCAAGTDFDVQYTENLNSYCNNYIAGGNDYTNCPFNSGDPLSGIVTYDNNECLSNELYPYWGQQSPDFNFNYSYYNYIGSYTDTMYAAICSGSPCELKLTGNGCYHSTTDNFSEIDGSSPTFLAYVTSTGDYLVDSLGNINYNINLLTYSLSNASPLPASYPCHNNNTTFDIPITVPGIYTLIFTYMSQQGTTMYYYVENGGQYYNTAACNPPFFKVVADTNPNIRLNPLSDTTICNGTQAIIYGQPGYTYTWTPSSNVTGYNIYYDFEANPTVATTYTVSVTDQYGCSENIDLTVNVESCAPTANFTQNLNDITCSSLCGQFFDASLGVPTQWQWSFPQGTPSSYTGKTPPNICYAAAGIYPVKLVVSNPAGKDSITKYIQVGTCKALAYFTETDTAICNSGCITFYYAMAAEYANDYTWLFPGGNPSGHYNSFIDSERVCYADTGVYKAYLITSGFDGNDTFSVRIHVTECSTPPVLPVAAFTYTYTDCQNKCSVYTNNSTGGTSWQWTFIGGSPSTYNGFTPPSICYNTAGTYSTQLIVSNSYGSDTAIQTFPVIDCRPVYQFVDGCASQCITFTDTTSKITMIGWQWTFEGASISSFSGQTTPPVCYADTGTFSAQLIETTYSYGYDTTNFSVRINNCAPNAAFTFTDSICNTQCTTYSDASGGSPLKWQWYFPGGNPSSFYGQYPPAVCYAYAGNYVTELIISNRYGSDTVEHTLTVKNCSPHATLFIPDTICNGQCVTLSNLSFSNVTTAKWQFTGGTPSSYNGLTPPTVCYNTPGNYNVQLVVSNSYGADTISGPLVVLNCQPVPASFHDTICQDQCIPFINPVSSNAVSWQWFFEGGTPSSFNGANPPVVCYATSGNYGITVIATNSYGNDTLQFSNSIVVLPSFTAYIRPKGDTLVCTSAVSYQWFFNNDIITGATKQDYVATKAGVYSVLVKGSSGCTEEVSYQLVFNGVSNTDIDDEIIISPNPNAGVFQVSGSMLQVASVEVYNTLGERILVSSIKTEDTRPLMIDLSLQPDGVYFVRVQTENGMVMKKVVKN